MRGLRSKSYEVILLRGVNFLVRDHMIIRYEMNRAAAEVFSCG